MKVRSVFLATMFAVCLGSATLKASSLGVDFIGSPDNFGDSVWNLGYEFQVNTDVTVTGLGNIDYGSVSSLPQPQQVGLWDSSGTLLASAYVNSSSTQIGNWAFTSIAPVALTAGDTYIVGGQGGADYAGITPVSVNPDITYLTDEYTSNGGANSPLVEPILTEGYTSPSEAGWFGGNVEFGTASTVPEPGSFLLVGSGLVLIGGYLRRKRRAA
jgi:hypothetical protein